MKFYVDTEFPVALDSPDHIEPRSTMLDNSVNLAFNRRLEQLYPGKRLKVLDLGCAGGGMVKSFVDAGHIAVGLEGSDVNLRAKRAEWATIPGNLLTCDIGKPFKIHTGKGKFYQFDVVTAWEFLEHLREDELETALENIRRHLKLDGLVIGSISDLSSVWKVIDHHQTRHPLGWWMEFFERRGFKGKESLVRYFEGAWVRAVRYNVVFKRLK